MTGGGCVELANSRHRIPASPSMPFACLDQTSTPNAAAAANQHCTAVQLGTPKHSLPAHLCGQVLWRPANQADQALGRPLHPHQAPHLRHGEQ